MTARYCGACRRAVSVIAAASARRCGPSTARRARRDCRASAASSASGRAPGVDRHRRRSGRVDADADDAIARELRIRVGRLRAPQAPTRAGRRDSRRDSAARGADRPDRSSTPPAPEGKSKTLEPIDPAVGAIGDDRADRSGAEIKADRIGRRRHAISRGGWGSRRRAHRGPCLPRAPVSRSS